MRFVAGGWGLVYSAWWGGGAFQASSSSAGRDPVGVGGTDAVVGVVGAADGVDVVAGVVAVGWRLAGVGCSAMKLGQSLAIGVQLSCICDIILVVRPPRS